MTKPPVVIFEPRTVYLPPAALAVLDERAANMAVASGLLLRLIVLGSQPPLTLPGR